MTTAELLSITFDYSDDIDVDALPAESQIKHWANAAYRQPGHSSVDFKIVNSDESQALNFQYRQQNKPTNVLSFPMDLPPNMGFDMLGDIAICDSVVAREAQEQGKTLDAHWAHMVIHGMLHLQGFDHQNDDEASQMEALEIALLAQCGYANPYANAPNGQ